MAGVGCARWHRRASCPTQGPLGRRNRSSVLRARAATRATVFTGDMHFESTLASYRVRVPMSNVRTIPEARQGTLPGRRALETWARCWSSCPCSHERRRQTLVVNKGTAGRTAMSGSCRTWPQQCSFERGGQGSGRQHTCTSWRTRPPPPSRRTAAKPTGQCP